MFKKTPNTAIVVFTIALFAFISCDLPNPPSLNPDGNPYAANVVAVSADIVSATTWQDGKVYYIASAVTVRTGATLLLQPGTIVKFGTEGSLSAESGATLNASGTSEKPIYFTSIRDTSVGGDSILNDAVTPPAPSDWNYLWIASGSNSNRFIYCHIRYAGKYGSAALDMRGRGEIDHCMFYNNLCGLTPWSSDYAALHILDQTKGVTLTNCTFYNNRWPLAIPSNMSLGTSNSFAYDDDNNSGTPDLNNTYQGICVNTTTMAGSTDWNETEVPYCLFDTISIHTGMTFNIANGAILKMTGNEISKYNGGTFNFGTAIFTSYKDDSCLGDTNHDGSASAPSVGDWSGIWFETGDWQSSANIRYSTN